jgi:hypothetical protein
MPPESQRYGCVWAHFVGGERAWIRTASGVPARGRSVPRWDRAEEEPACREDDHDGSGTGQEGTGPRRIRVSRGAATTRQSQQGLPGDRRSGLSTGRAALFTGTGSWRASTQMARRDGGIPPRDLHGVSGPRRSLELPALAAAWGHHAMRHRRGGQGPRAVVHRLAVLHRLATSKIRAGSDTESVRFPGD